MGTLLVRAMGLGVGATLTVLFVDIIGSYPLFASLLLAGGIKNYSGPKREYVIGPLHSIGAFLITAFCTTYLGYTWNLSELTVLGIGGGAYYAILLLGASKPLLRLVFGLPLVFGITSLSILVIEHFIDAIPNAESLYLILLALPSQLVDAGADAIVHRRVGVNSEDERNP